MKKKKKPLTPIEQARDLANAFCRGGLTEAEFEQQFQALVAAQGKPTARQQLKAAQSLHPAPEDPRLAWVREQLGMRQRSGLNERYYQAARQETIDNLKNGDVEPFFRSLTLCPRYSSILEYSNRRL